MEHKIKGKTISSVNLDTNKIVGYPELTLAFTDGSRVILNLAPGPIFIEELTRSVLMEVPGGMVYDDVVAEPARPGDDDNDYVVAEPARPEDNIRLLQEDF